jgi:hypothetical protein
MVFPGRKEELLRIRDAMLQNLNRYLTAHRDESDKDEYPPIHCQMLNWERITNEASALEQLLLTGVASATVASAATPEVATSSPTLTATSPAIATVNSTSTANPANTVNPTNSASTANPINGAANNGAANAVNATIARPAAANSTTVAGDNGNGDSEMQEKFRARVQLMVKAGKGQIGPAQQKVLDKEQVVCGLTAEQAQAIIQQVLGKGGNNAAAKQDYAVFFLSLYHNGENPITAELRTLLEEERARLALDSTTTTAIEQQIIDYFDYYCALVTDAEVADWVRVELQTKQQELGIATELVSLIEEHIASLR